MGTLQRSGHQGRPTGVRAGRWRAFALGWLGVYPVVTALFATFGPQLQVLPLALRTMVVSLVVVGFMVFVWTPLLARLTATPPNQRSGQGDAEGQGEPGTTGS